MLLSFKKAKSEVAICDLHPNFDSDFRSRNSDIRILTFRLPNSDIRCRILSELPSRKSDVGTSECRPMINERILVVYLIRILSVISLLQWRLKRSIRASLT